MTEKELFEKNLEISSEFSRYIIAHPEVAKEIPPNAEVIFLVASDPNLSRCNLELAKKLQESGQKIVFVKIEGLRAAEETRLIKPHLEFA